MKHCKYIVNGVPYKYDDLVNLMKNDSELVNDILYSLDTGVLARIIDKLEALKEVGKRKFKKEFSDNVDIINGCAEINVDGYTLLSFIDSGLFIKDDGELIMPVLKVEEFLQKMEAVYKSKNLSKEEIKYNLEIIKQNWKRIAEDGRDLHKIILRAKPNSTYTEIDELTKGTSFEHLGDIIRDTVYDDIFKQIKLRNGIESKEMGDTSSPKIIKNINISAKLLGRDETITGHIDYIVVKPDGTLEIFNIKSSHESPEFWDRAKKEKYMNEFALLARILQYNGINVKNIRFNVIPVVLKYDDLFKEIESIDVHKFECYSHNKSAFVMQEPMMYASKFIVSNATEFVIEGKSIDNVNKLLKTLFPEMNVKAQGITKTAEEYVDSNWRYLTLGKLPDSGYIITLGGKKYQIQSSERKSKNTEIVNLVKKHQLELIDSGLLSASGIINQINEFRRYGFPNFDNDYLNKFFSPYFTDREVVKVDGKEKYNYRWKIIDNQTLKDCNIIAFKNDITGLLNVVVLSAMSLNSKHKFLGNSNILGAHLSDMNAFDNKGLKLMDATYGNIETIRALFLLNEILPSIEEDIKLGDISIIGNIGYDTKGLTYPMLFILPNFVKALQTLNLKEASLNIKNNFSNIPNISLIQLLINEFYDILDENASLGKTAFKEIKDLIVGSEQDKMMHLINGSVVDSLATAESTEILIQRLEELIAKLNTILKTKIKLTPEEIVAQSQRSLNKTSEDLIPACCKLLVNASITLDRLSGIIRLSEKDLSTDDKYFARPLNIDNNLVRIVGSLLLNAIHNTSLKLEDKISDFNNLCLEYYKIKGYSASRNAWMGDQANVFSHLYLDIEDELFFKNPYDMTNDLDPDDRAFLKEVIFIINNTRDPNIVDKKFIEEHIDDNPNYLWVPLEKASKSTRWTNPSKYFEDFGRRVANYCKNPMLFFREMYEGILTDEEQNVINTDIENLLAYNAFNASNTKKGRKRLMEYGKDYFETNVQNLVIDFVYKDIQTKELEHMLVRTKGILLHLKLSGIKDFDNDKYADSIKYINDYLKTGVFKVSIMNEDSKQWVAKLSPLREAVSKCYIALSPLAAVRDTIAGFLSNNLRAASKYKTDIDVSDVLWAYLYIIGKGVHTAMDIDLLDKFNTKYLISNINLSLQQEGYKTNRGGITNIDNLLYATLRKPDYLNRMVLFIAKLKKDGSHKAYSVINGKLVYNWRLDERFNLLANQDMRDMDAYNKQKALYLSQIIKHNEENPSNPLPVRITTDLVDGYTLNQIEEIKHLSDAIYGSYDASTKAAYENMALGSQLGVFSTWMNGIYDVWLGRRRTSSYETMKKLAVDDNGNKLWIDEEGRIVTTETDTPYMDDVPLVVQGILRTVGDAFTMLYHGKSVSEIYKEMKLNPMLARNWRRLFTDLLVWFILGQLFKLLIDPAYKDHKKNSNGLEVLTNAIIELLYKGSAGSFEEFRGPAPIIDYVTNNIKPASWLFGQRILTDSYNTLFGEKTVNDLIFKYSALPRSLLDTYKMYQRDTINGVN